MSRRNNFDYEIDPVDELSLRNLGWTKLFVLTFDVSNSSRSAVIMIAWKASLVVWLNFSMHDVIYIHQCARAILKACYNNFCRWEREREREMVLKSWIRAIAVFNLIINYYETTKRLILQKLRGYLVIYAWKNKANREIEWNFIFSSNSFWKSK